jgi:quercetin dioxygenase-like cupin family protein
MIKLSIKYFLFFLIIFFLDCESKTSANQADKWMQELPDPLEAGWEGQSVCEVVEENDELRILKCTFPPGVGHEKHFHPPHVGYTLSGGKFRMIDDKRTREVDVPVGYVFVNDTVTTHEVLNIGETTAQFLIIEYK